MYSLIRDTLFLLDAEKAHYVSMNMLRVACSIKPIRQLISGLFSPDTPSLETALFGLRFKNPVGLGAGFDKNAVYLRELEALGFGFVEIGTATPLPQEGNEKPRLFRIPADKALINRMGFNNDGVKKIKERLATWKAKNEEIPSGQRMIIGGNIGKNKITANEDAWKDYEICFNELFDVVDYFVVNVSSPNTPGLRALQDKESLLKILGTLQENNSKRAVRKPILLKIAPDLTDEQLADIAEISTIVKLDGIVSSNTTISRAHLSLASKQMAEKIGMGGLSGRPLKETSDQILKTIISLTHGKIPVIASGGIFTGEDAKEKMDAGASLVQVWTGFIYEGPTITKKICKVLAK
jgi:dihydroorotate dehydrogenase